MSEKFIIYHRDGRELFSCDKRDMIGLPKQKLVLKNADFSDFCQYAPQLEDISFEGCSLRYSLWASVNMHKCRLNDCDLTGAIFLSCNTSKCNFRGANLRNALFDAYSLAGVEDRLSIFQRENLLEYYESHETKLDLTHSKVLNVISPHIDTIRRELADIVSKFE